MTLELPDDWFETTIANNLYEEARLLVRALIDLTKREKISWQDGIYSPRAKNLIESCACAYNYYSSSRVGSFSTLVQDIEIRFEVEASSYDGDSVWRQHYSLRKNMLTVTRSKKQIFTSEVHQHKLLTQAIIESLDGKSSRKLETAQNVRKQIEALQSEEKETSHEQSRARTA